MKNYFLLDQIKAERLKFSIKNFPKISQKIHNFAYSRASELIFFLGERSRRDLSVSVKKLAAAEIQQK